MVRKKNKPQTPTSVPSELRLTHTTIYRWMKNPDDMIKVSIKQVKKQKVFSISELILVEQDIKLYIIGTIQMMNAVMPISEDIISRLDLEVRHKLMKLLEELCIAEDDDITQKMEAEKQNMKDLKVSYGWYSNFLAR